MNHCNLICGMHTVTTSATCVSNVSCNKIFKVKSVGALKSTTHNNTHSLIQLHTSSV